VDELVLHGGAALERLLTAAGRLPARTALLCDIDGTVSPIAPTPQQAAVPPETRELLAALTRRLGLVALITGRTVADARRLADVPGAAYVGAHGLETMSPGGEAHIAPQAEAWLPLLRETAEAARRDLDWERFGILLEQKPAGFAAHYRQAPDKDAARHEILRHVAQPARARGLAVQNGHFVLEVRPPVPLTKGTAARRLLGDGELLTALVCGDDLTDVAAVEAAPAWAARDARRLACAVAAVTAETPAPVKEAADAQVRATPGVTAVLTRLLAAAGG
jgi:trehalose 6-phosphate phosphatase